MDEETKRKKVTCPGSHSQEWRSLCVLASLVTQRVKHSPAMQETWVWSLSWEDTLGEEMATHSSILAWRISWTKEPGGLQSVGSQRVRHDWAHEFSCSVLSPVSVGRAKARTYACLLPAALHFMLNCWRCGQLLFTENFRAMPYSL